MRISDWSSDVCSSDLSKKNDSRRDAETRRCVVRGAVARASGQSLPGNLGFHSLADARRKQKHTVSLRVSASLREPFFSFFAPSHDSLFVLFPVLHPLIHAMIPVALCIGPSHPPRQSFPADTPRPSRPTPPSEDHR